MTPLDAAVIICTLLAVTVFCLMVLGLIETVKAIRSAVHLRPVNEIQVPELTANDMEWFRDAGFCFTPEHDAAPILDPCDCCGKPAQYHDEIPVRTCCIEGQRMDFGLHEQGEDIRPILFKAAEPPKQVASVGNTGAVRVRPTAERA